MGKIRKFRSFLVSILLVAILIIVSILYITKSYSVIKDNYQKFQEQKAQHELDKAIEEENIRREMLLKKYDITKLEKINPCKDSSKKCTDRYIIPNEVINYLVG